jgi:hypothetical protein
MRSKTSRTASGTAKEWLQIFEELTFWEEICKTPKAHAHDSGPLPRHMESRPCLSTISWRVRVQQYTTLCWPVLRIKNLRGCCGGVPNTTDVAYRRPHSADQPFSCQAPYRPSNSVNIVSIESVTLLTKHSVKIIGIRARGSSISTPLSLFL